MSMKQLFTSATCVGLLLAATVTAASAANLLTNPGFETGDLSGWSVFQANANAFVTVQSPDNGPALPGTHNAFMDNHAEAVGLTLAQTTPNGSAVPGTVYYSFDLKLGQAANGGVFFVEIFAQNSAGAVISHGPGLLGNYTPANWTTFTGSFVAPANTDHLTIQFEAPTGAVVGSISSMHVDNVDLHQNTVVPAQSTTWGRMKALYR